MKIGILGAGSVGTALAGAWWQAGHDVRIGVRDPAAPREGLSPRARLALVPLQLAADSDVVLVATPWGATLDMLRQLDLSGRILIDATNPVSVSRAGLSRLPTQSASGAQDIAAAVPDAQVFKSLNQAGANILGDARSVAVPPLMFVAGDAGAGKATVMELVKALGFDARDAGGLDAAVHLESLAWLWIHQAITGGTGRDFAFAAMPATGARS